MSVLEHCIELAPDPQAASLRLDRMRQDAAVRRYLDALPPRRLGEFVALISVSRFLFHFLCRHPEVIALGSEATSVPAAKPPECRTADELRLYKYRELFRIAWRDVSSHGAYEDVLAALTSLAEVILRQAMNLAVSSAEGWIWRDSLCVCALGKLGAGELNFSSDIDLVFLSDNHGPSGIEIGPFQKRLSDALRDLVRFLEEKTADGFLYRVDLNLRPWGRSGPLFMAIDDAEHYFEASSDPWERYAWLRARPIAGAVALGEDLRQRLQPFIFTRSLGSQDLDRFVGIKNEISRVRSRRGHWNVKVGEGGIRDIEFFVQTLQLVNGARCTYLQSTNTLHALAGLMRAGLISRDEEGAMRRAYLFLRRLENRLQMVDEQQTHELPDEPARRRVLARSLGFASGVDEESLHNFETELSVARSVARTFFERILPAAAA